MFDDVVEADKTYATGLETIQSMGKVCGGLCSGVCSQRSCMAHMEELIVLL